MRKHVNKLLAVAAIAAVAFYVGPREMSAETQEQTVGGASYCCVQIYTCASSTFCSANAAQRCAITIDNTKTCRNSGGSPCGFFCSASFASGQSC